MWEINNLTQISSFLYSVVLGCIYCVLYDIIRAIRKVYKSSDFVVFIQDILFFIICAISCFCFLLSLTNGKSRIYIFVGILAGFILFRFSISILLFKFFCIVLNLLKKFFNTLNKILTKFFAISDKFFDLIINKLVCFIKYIKKCLKKPLKKRGNMMYTNSNRVK